MTPATTALRTLGPADPSVPRPLTQGARPGTGSVMRQQFGISKIQAQVKELLGAFNPKWVGFDTRLLMRDDPTVAFGLAVLLAPIINGRWGIDSNDPKIEAFVEQVIRAKYHELATGGTMSVPNGYQPIEKVWKVEDVTVEVEEKSTGTMSSFRMPQAWVFDEFKALDPRTINMLIDPATDKWAGFEQFPVTFDRATSPVPARIGVERCFLWSYRRQQVWGRLQGRPHLNQCYEPWYWKAALNLFCNRYFERKAEPNFKAHAPAEIMGPNNEKIDGAAFMASVLSALKNGEAICLPGEMDEKGNRLVDVEFLQDDKRGDMFQQRFDYLDLQILKALWIPDRAGSSSRAGAGIGSGESSVHYEMLQKLIESVAVEWFREVQTQVVDPAVLYNFGPEALAASKTRITYSGMSDFHRDLMKTILNTMQNAEVALADGQVIRLMEYMDAVEMCEELGLPIKRADQIGALAHKRIDPGPPDGSNPKGNTGDTNVQGRQTGPTQASTAVKPAGSALRDQLAALRQEMKDVASQQALSRLEEKHARELYQLMDKLDRAEERARVKAEAEALALANRPSPLTGPDKMQPIEIHHHAGDVNVPPQKIEMHHHAGDVSVKAGDVHNNLTLKPGEKSATVIGPDGSKTTVTVKPMEGGGA